MSLQCHHPKSLHILVLENSLLSSELLVVVGLMEGPGFPWLWAVTMTGGTLLLPQSLHLHYGRRPVGWRASQEQARGCCANIWPVLSCGLLILPFNQYLFSTHRTPDPVLGSKHRTVGERDESPCSRGTYILVGETDEKQGE